MDLHSAGGITASPGVSVGDVKRLAENMAASNQEYEAEYVPYFWHVKSAIDICEL
jgi:hypothetical protein